MIPFMSIVMFGFREYMNQLGPLEMQEPEILLGATSGRTTLNSEGLQHQDGRSHLFAKLFKLCVI